MAEFWENPIQKKWEIIGILFKIYTESFQNRSEIDPRSMRIRFWSVFGAKSRPSRLADGFRKLPGYHFWRQGGLKRCSGDRFWDLVVPKIRLKSRFWAQVGTLTQQKCSLSGGSEKTWKFNEKTMWKSEVFDGSEPRLVLYSSLITHFRRFRKKSKNRCQKGAQK